MNPITLITYNRPFHTYKTLEALSKNYQAKDTDLYVFSDGPKEGQDAEQIDLTLKVIQKFDKSFNRILVRKSDKNNGMAKNTRDALRSIFFEHKASASIILDDDIVTSKNFLLFMNKSIEKYREHKNIWHVCGHNYPVIEEKSHDFIYDAFFWRGMTPWGWATWKDRYESFENDPLAKDPYFLKSVFTEEMKKKFELDLEQSNSNYYLWHQIEENASRKKYTWAIFWYAHIFRNNGLCLNSTRSLVYNNGFDGSGVSWTGWADNYSSKLFIGEFLNEKIKFPPTEKEDQKMVSLIRKYFTKPNFYYKTLLLFRLLLTNRSELTRRLRLKLNSLLMGKY